MTRPWRGRTRFVRKGEVDSIVMGRPHPLQNFAPSGTPVPQAGQTIAASSRLHRVIRVQRDSGSVRGEKLFADVRSSQVLAREVSLRVVGAGRGKLVHLHGLGTLVQDVVDLPGVNLRAAAQPVAAVGL